MAARCPAQAPRPPGRRSGVSGGWPPPSSSRAWGTTSMMASIDSTAPRVDPGTLTIRQEPMVPATPRDRRPSGLAARMASAEPGRIPLDDASGSPPGSDRSERTRCLRSSRRDRGTRWPARRVRRTPASRRRARSGPRRPRSRALATHRPERPPTCPCEIPAKTESETMTTFASSATRGDATLPTVMPTGVGTLPARRDHFGIHWPFHCGCPPDSGWTVPSYSPISSLAKS